MILVDFVYDKKNGETPRRRFVAVARNDERDVYLSGYDLTDGGCLYKDFLKNRIIGDIHSCGNFSESELRAAKIITSDEVFNMLNWSDEMVQVFRELSGDVNKLCKWVHNKSGKKISPLQDDLFLLLGDVELVFNIVNGFDLYEMKIREGVLEFSQGNEKLTTLEFTRRLLGLS